VFGLPRIGGPLGSGAPQLRAPESRNLSGLLDQLVRSGRIVVNQTPTLTRGERSKIFLSLLAAAHAAQIPRSKADAFALVNAAMNTVEDRYSGITYKPNLERDCGRMLPMTDDLYVGSATYWSAKPADTDVLIGNADVYETRANFVLVADNGATELWLSPRVTPEGVVEGPAKCLWRAAGRDGLTISKSIGLR
jgi:hypothetical protein